jgi:hypothetical protein
LLIVIATAVPQRRTFLISDWFHRKYSIFFGLFFHFLPNQVQSPKVIMATALTAALKLPSLCGMRSQLLLSPESDAVSSPRPKKMRFRRRRSSSTSSSTTTTKQQQHQHQQPKPEQSRTGSGEPTFPSLPTMLLKEKSKTKALSSSVLQRIETNLPHDVIPKILAFCGPQTTAKLQRCSRFWYATISSDQTWRVLCEELYKVRMYAV